VVTAAELRKFWHRSPFVPFEITLPGRSKLKIPHPDFLTVSPTGRVAHVWTRDDDYAVVDIFLITALETNSRATKQKRSRHRRRN
jgi:hypothetical protein